MTTDSPCIPNIGPRERRRRMLMGIAMALLVAGAAGWLVASGAPRAWRVLVFVPAWIGALDVLQVRASTCVLLAARGARNMDSGNEPIADPAELTRVRAQARSVHARSALAALGVTALVLAA
jgi:hypothetical protein